jgi:hypothetical protein
VTAERRDGAVRIFSMLFGLVYIGCFYMDWSPLRYYPDKGTYHVHAHPGDGPAILWYGWLGAAAAVSAVVAAATPRRIANRVGDGWAWIVPLLTMIGILIYERRWFV